MLHVTCYSLTVYTIDYTVTFDRTSRRLAVGLTYSEAAMKQDMYGKLTLVSDNAWAILAKIQLAC